MTFSDKIKRSREIVGLTQDELAAQVGVSRRTITAYECTDAMARRSTVTRLARALKVSVKYLMDESCTDPLADIEKDAHVEEARRLYGASGARDVDALLSENAALFAGGDLSQEEKDAFFEAVMRAYVACKDEARRKFGTDK
jgi:transcriptional regulator with XRE-family HTH domain